MSTEPVNVIREFVLTFSGKSDNIATIGEFDGSTGSTLLAVEPLDDNESVTSKFILEVELAATSSANPDN